MKFPRIPIILYRNIIHILVLPYNSEIWVDITVSDLYLGVDFVALLGLDATIQRPRPFNITHPYIHIYIEAKKSRFIIQSNGRLNS